MSTQLQVLSLFSSIGNGSRESSHSAVGREVGAVVGKSVGACDGVCVGREVGAVVGKSVGACDGVCDGVGVGSGVTSHVSARERNDPAAAPASVALCQASAKAA